MTPAGNPGLLSFTVRLLIAAAFVISLGGAFRSEIVSALIPAFRIVIEAVDDYFNIIILDVTQRNADEVLRLRVDLARVIFLNGHTTHPVPGGWLEVTTTLGTVLQSGLSAFITALAWPAARISELSLRMAICLVLAVLLVLADAPIDLLAYIWDMFIYAQDPEGFYPIWKYHQFMIGGGRFALGAVAGILAVIWATWVSHHIIHSRHTGPH